MTGWQVLLLGGTTASGKSTSAALVARKLGIGCVSGDSIWRAILAVTTPETHPVLHEWPRADEDPGDPESLARLHIQEAKMLTPAIEAFLDKEMHEGNRFVFHCAWVTPELALSMSEESPIVRSVFIDEPLEDEIMTAILARTGRTEPTTRQMVIARTAALYGNWLREGAQRHRLPLVSALPRDTLADRIIESAEGGRRVSK